MSKFQVCFDVYNEVRVCYETDSEYEAQCYIGEMYSMGDYSNYYIRRV